VRRERGGKLGLSRTQQDIHDLVIVAVMGFAVLVVAILAVGGRG